MRIYTPPELGPEFPLRLTSSNRARRKLEISGAPPACHSGDTATRSKYRAAPCETRLEKTKAPPRSHAKSPGAHHKPHCDYRSTTPKSLRGSLGNAARSPRAALVPRYTTHVRAPPPTRCGDLIRRGQFPLGWPLIQVTAPRNICGCAKDTDSQP